MHGAATTGSAQTGSGSPAAARPELGAGTIKRQLVPAVRAGSTRWFRRSGLGVIDCLFPTPLTDLVDADFGWREVWEYVL